MNVKLLDGLGYKLTLVEITEVINYPPGTLAMRCFPRGHSFHQLSIGFLDDGMGYDEHLIVIPYYYGLVLKLIDQGYARLTICQPNPAKAETEQAYAEGPVDRLYHIVGAGGGC